MNRHRPASASAGLNGSRGPVLALFCATAVLTVLLTRNSEADSSRFVVSQAEGQCRPGKQVFAYTGSAQTLVPPVGCKVLVVKAWGAGGAGSIARDGWGRAGGAGGFVTAQILVTAATYTVVVGGGGPSGPGLPGGYGGGGRAGSAGGAGGGRSAVQLGSVDLITAGGGGGGGYGDIGETGGGGGGLSGASPAARYSGAGGTQIAGGAAGRGASASPGALYVGGQGDQSGGFTAGGGGGWYGGGGGSSGPGEGGAGGGGSSYMSGAHVLDGSMSAGSGRTPGDSHDRDHARGVGVGGSAGPMGDGGAGSVIVYWR